MLASSAASETISPTRWRLIRPPRVLIAVCVAPQQGQTQCPAFGGLDAEVSISQALIELANNATPSATGISGTLLSTDARGSTEVSLNASDREGPGVYNVTLQVDGRTVYSATPDSNAGACVPAGSQGGVLIFQSIQPCRQNESVTIPVNTTAFADGPHTLKITLTDAANNTSVVYDGQITTSNAPQANTGPSLNAAGQLYTGTTLSVKPGSWTAPSGAGGVTYTYTWQDCDPTGANCTTITGAQNSEYTPTPADIGHTLRALITAADNDGSTLAASTQSGVVLVPQESLGAAPGGGTPGPSAGTTTGPSTAGSPGVPNGAFASENALLYLGVPSRITESYQRRAFQLNDRLLNREGHPILGATLAITQQLPGSTQTTTIATVKTGETGEFSLPVPAGPSRTITVSYRALSTDAAPAARPRERTRLPDAKRLTTRHQQPRDSQIQRHRRRANPARRNMGRPKSPLSRAMAVLRVCTRRPARALPRRIQVPGRHSGLSIPGRSR